MKIFIFIKR